MQQKRLFLCVVILLCLFTGTPVLAQENLTPNREELQEAVQKYISKVNEYTRADPLTDTPQWVWDLYHQIQREALEEANRCAAGDVWMVKQRDSKPGGSSGDETATEILLGDLREFCKLELKDIPGWSSDRQAQALAFWQSWQNSRTGRFYNPRLMDPQNPKDPEGICNEKYVVAVIRKLGGEPKYPWSIVAKAGSGDKAGQIDTKYFIELSRTQLTSGDCSHIGSMCSEIMKAIENGHEEYIPAMEEGIENIMAQQNPENGLWDSLYRDLPYSRYAPTAGALKILGHLHNRMGMENAPYMDKLADTLIEKQPFFSGIHSVTRNTSELMVYCLDNSDYRRDELLEAMRKNAEGLKGKGRGKSSYAHYCLDMMGRYLWKDCPFTNYTQSGFGQSRGTAWKYRLVMQPDGKTVKLIKKKPQEFITHPDYQFSLFGRKITPSSGIAFYDWYHIWAGNSTYDKDGTLKYSNAPRGIRLEVQPAKKSKVFLKREMPWEQGYMGHMFVLQEDGKYRMWYKASPVLSGYEGYMCYAESTDGFHWNRPSLGMYEYEGSTENNIINTDDRLGLHCVFIDPTAPPEQKYKGIICGVELFRDGKRIPYTMQDKWDIRNKRKALEVEGFKIEELDKRMRVGKAMVQGVVSPDGIHWTTIEEPLIYPGALDTQNIADYDVGRGEYIFYIRGHHHRRRSVRLTGGKEFGNWPEPKHVLLTDALDPPDMDIYTTCFCREPLEAGFRWYLMFPAMYHRDADIVDIQFAASRDGVQWTRPSRSPIISRDSDDPAKPYGTMYAGPNLVTLKDDLWALPYNCNSRRHNTWDWDKHAMVAPDGEYRWATWKQHRLVGVAADSDVDFAVVGEPVVLGHVQINFQTTSPDGWIKVGLIENCSNKGEPFKSYDGYDIQQCDILNGDQINARIRWEGNTDISRLKGETIYLHVKMYKAKLYSITL